MMMRSEVVRALLTAAEGGLLGLLSRSWIGDLGHPGFATGSGDDGDFRPASLKQLWSVFAALAAGQRIAVLILCLGLCLAAKGRRKDQTSISEEGKSKYKYSGCKCGGS